MAAMMFPTMTTAADEILSARDLAVSIGGKTVCKSLSFSIRAGECWGILGTNGVGKTTLLLTLAGLRQPQSGEVLLQGRPLEGIPRREVARKLGLMFQDLEPGLPTTVMETALEGRHPHLDRFKWETTEDERIAREALEEMELHSMAGRIVQTLSGGERRLLAAATLFTQEPLLMGLDEPNSHLDLHQQIKLLDRVQHRVRHQGKAALTILHDANLASRYCDRVLLLFGDGEVEGGPTDELLTAERMSRLYRHPIRRIPIDTGAIFVAM